MNVVIEKYGLSKSVPPTVQDADNILLITEWRDLVDDNETWRTIYPNLQPLSKPIKPWSWKKAEREFLKRFAKLTSDRSY